MTDRRLCRATRTATSLIPSPQKKARAVRSRRTSRHWRNKVLQGRETGQGDSNDVRTPLLRTTGTQSETTGSITSVLTSESALKTPLSLNLLAFRVKIRTKFEEQQRKMREYIERVESNCTDTFHWLFECGPLDAPNLKLEEPPPELALIEGIDKITVPQPPEIIFDLRGPLEFFMPEYSLDFGGVDPLDDEEEPLENDLWSD